MRNPRINAALLRHRMAEQQRVLAAGAALTLGPVMLGFFAIDILTGVI